MTNKLDAKTLCNLLEYDAESGTLTWKHRDASAFTDLKQRANATAQMWNKKFAGKPAFTAIGNGYYRGSIFDKRYEAHRVIWALHNGEWPKSEIDHIDGNGLNNRLINLRLASRTDQTRNSAMPRTNKSGVVGVCQYRNSTKWKAFIHLNNRVKHLGTFANKQDAIQVRKQAELLHNFHPNHGRKRA